MTAAVVLAAGQGRRMYSDLPKVAHPVLGRPMILRVLETARECGFDKTVTVIGHGRERLVPVLDAAGFGWVVQEEQRGTAHAVSCALPECQADEVMVLLGDVPLLRARTILGVLSARREAVAAVAVLTATPPDPSGYGRVVRGSGPEIEKIVEERDATPSEKAIRETNTGVMAFDGSVLASLLAGVGNSNSQQEFYLTDTISVARSLGRSTVAVHAADWIEVAGVNDQFQLAEASLQQCRRLLESHMVSGVSFTDPASVWIEDSVRIGTGTRIGRFVKLAGGASIGAGCILGDGCIVCGRAVPAGTVLAPYTVLVKP